MWMDIESAPRTGDRFLARTIERAPFSVAPKWRYEEAWWTGTERTGHFASESGAIPVYWLPFDALPSPPETTDG